MNIGNLDVISLIEDEIIIRMICDTKSEPGVYCVVKENIDNEPFIISGHGGEIPQKLCERLILIFLFESSTYEEAQNFLTVHKTHNE